MTLLQASQLLRAFPGRFFKLDCSIGDSTSSSGVVGWVSYEKENEVPATRANRLGRRCAGTFGHQPGPPRDQTERKAGDLISDSRICHDLTFIHVWNR